MTDERDALALRDELRRLRWELLAQRALLLLAILAVGAAWWKASRQPRELLRAQRVEARELVVSSADGAHRIEFRADSGAARLVLGGESARWPRLLLRADSAEARVELSDPASLSHAVLRHGLLQLQQGSAMIRMRDTLARAELQLRSAAGALTLAPDSARGVVLTRER